jgi:hypothetical protein
LRNKRNCYENESNLPEHPSKTPQSADPAQFHFKIAIVPKWAHGGRLIGLPPPLCPVAELSYGINYVIERDEKCEFNCAYPYAHDALWFVSAWL